MTDYSGVSLKTGALHVFEGSTTDKTILQCGTISGDVTITLGGTASGDAAAIGYTSADGIVITGQGSTSDVTIKNDADTAVLTIATGTTNVDVAGDLTAATITCSGFTVDADGDTALKSLAVDDGSTIGCDSVTDLITIAGTGDITIKDGSYDFDLAAHDGTNGLKLGGALVTSSAAELNYNDITTLGSSQASKVLTADASGDITIVGASANVVWDKSEDALEFADNASIEIGTGLDMKLYHDGSNSYITNAVGALKVATETSGIAVTIGHSTSEVTVGDNLTVTGNHDVLGALTVGTSTGSSGTVKLNGTTKGSVTLATPDSVTLDDNSTELDYTITLPALPPSANEFLKITSYGSDIAVTEWASGAGGSSTFAGLSDASYNSGDSNSSIFLGHNPTNDGANNIGIGKEALDSLSGSGSPDYNIAIGNNALTANTTGARNFGIGNTALTANTTGGANVGIGDTALTANTTGNFNVGIGDTALTANTTGAYNVGIGNASLVANTVGYYNMAIGDSALRANVAGATNTAIGHQALYSSTSASAARTDNTALGHSAGYAITSGTKNTIIGGFAAFGESISSTLGTDGNSTTSFALQFGVGIVGPGGEANYYVGHTITFTSGNNNGEERTVSASSNSLGTLTLTVSVAFSNTPGSGSAFTLTNGNTSLTTGANNTVIGFSAGPSLATISNEFTLGNSSISTLRCADTTIASLSDSRDKTNVVDSPYGLDFINSLRPVQYTWQRRVLEASDFNHHKNGLNRVGFLAQDFLAAMPNNENDVLDLVYESNSERLEAKYGNLIPVLTQAIKDLKAQNDALTARVAALESA
jgi:trimeric autotransporter adhesin